MLNKKSLYKDRNQKPGSISDDLPGGCCRSLSNNLSENSIPPVTVSRKKWLFPDTPDGANANALYLTIVEMTNAYNLILYEYLKYLLKHRPNKNMLDDELGELAMLRSPSKNVTKKLCKMVALSESWRLDSDAVWGTP